ncbi:7869_t:CDS:10 [Paraglomus brasilianum]|uniref:7869_t:CDS:1 n=1 Tax=Paraglomus brasilianum TaxID=144538 RepID=A0A9N8ZEA7_9GLOM|nr:7869_t:CDS:10 [Paraglomus brasilianum]
MATEEREAGRLLMVTEEMEIISTITTRRPLEPIWAGTMNLRLFCPILRSTCSTESTAYHSNSIGKVNEGRLEHSQTSRKRVEGLPSVRKLYRPAEWDIVVWPLGNFIEREDGTLDVSIGIITPISEKMYKRMQSLCAQMVNGIRLPPLKFPINSVAYTLTTLFQMPAQLYFKFYWIHERDGLETVDLGKVLLIKRGYVGVKWNAGKPGEDGGCPRAFMYTRSLRYDKEPDYDINPRHADATNNANPRHNINPRHANAINNANIKHQPTGI